MIVVSVVVMMMILGFRLFLFVIFDPVRRSIPLRFARNMIRVKDTTRFRILALHPALQSGRIRRR